MFAGDYTGQMAWWVWLLIIGGSVCAIILMAYVLADKNSS
eukprot:COSAG01_NODE_49895_length_368_cov_0.765799_1_plen_39_part_10